MEQKTLLIRFSPAQDEVGNIIGYYGLISDVSQLTAAKKAAEEKEDLFRATFDQSPVPMFQVSPDLKILQCNSAWSEMSGYSQSESLGRSILDFTHPEDIEPSKAFTQSLLQGANEIHRFEKKYYHKSGRILTALVNSRAIRDEKGALKCLISVVEDVTEARERQAELQISQARMAASAKMASLGEMSAGIAHEINNPLAIIHA